MSKIIAVNAGSSSLKFQLYEMPAEKVLVSGVIEKIGLEQSIVTIKHDGQKKVSEPVLPTHKEAVNVLLKALDRKSVV